jgi:hypothetical protein
MDPALWATLWAGVGACCVLVLLLVAGAAKGRRWRQSAAVRTAPDGRVPEAALAAALADVEALRAQVDRLSTELAARRPGATATDNPATGGTPPRAGAAAVVPVASDYVITTAGEPERPTQVPERAVLSVTLGEPLVKLAAFGYAVRKALSPESRNRIAFEMRREVKRARKERRRHARRARVATPRRAEEAA